MDRYIQTQEIERKGKSYSVCQRESDGYHGLIKTSWLTPSGFVDQNGNAVLMARSKTKAIRIMMVDWFFDLNEVK